MKSETKIVTVQNGTEFSEATRKFRCLWCFDDNGTVSPLVISNGEFLWGFSPFSIKATDTEHFPLRLVVDDSDKKCHVRHDLVSAVQKTANCPIYAMLWLSKEAAIKMNELFQELYDL